MTRSSSRHALAPECHVLNFFCDSEDGCAFTTLVRGYRFHIIADAEKLKSNTELGTQLGKKYKSLVHAARGKFEEEEGSPKDNKRKRNEENPDSRDSALGSSPPHASEADEDDVDSAVDVDEKDEEQQAKPIGVQRQGMISGEQHDDPEKALQNWMLEPFAQIFQDLGTSSDDIEEQSLEEWYSGPTYFYDLEIKGDALDAVELESQPDLEERIKSLIPRMSLPKSLRNLHVPWVRPSEAMVISESSEPDLYHPSRITLNDEVHFFKAVDMTQPQTMKRELKIMNDIEKKGLHKKIRAPRVTGLVGFEDSKTEIMGFLMTDIEDPTPLTKMLDTDVIEDKRDQWARESKRMVEVLHDNDIIWGDAKADNFLVDKHSNLWIIDFGGSYTEGWVDPDLMETIEGDNMGIEKVVNALEDPEANTYDPEEEEQDRGAGATTRSSPRQPTAGKKRSRDETDISDSSSPQRKKRF